MKLLLATTLSLVAISSVKAAAAEMISVPSDPSAQYAIVVDDVGLGRSALMVISKRDGPSGTSYAIREVNCTNSTFRYMGEGDSLEEAIASVNDRSKMSALVEGSISYFVVRAACK